MRFFKDKSERVLRLVQDLGYHLLMHDKEQYALEDVTEITEAEDEVQAKELAMNNRQWCIHEQICRGNVLPAVLNEISVEEV